MFRECEVRGKQEQPLEQRPCPSAQQGFCLLLVSSSRAWLCLFLSVHSWTGLVRGAHTCRLTVIKRNLRACTEAGLLREQRPSQDAVSIATPDSGNAVWWAEPVNARLCSHPGHPHKCASRATESSTAALICVPRQRLDCGRRVMLQEP